MQVLSNGPRVYLRRDVKMRRKEQDNLTITKPCPRSLTFNFEYAKRMSRRLPMMRLMILQQGWFEATYLYMHHLDMYLISPERPMAADFVPIMMFLTTAKVYHDIVPQWVGEMVAWWLTPLMGLRRRSVWRACAHCPPQMGQFLCK